MRLNFWFIFITVLMVSVNAADESLLAEAAKCEAITPTGTTSYERANWHQDQVRCLQDLYIQAGVPNSTIQIAAEIQDLLVTLEAAYYASRALCEVQNKHGQNIGNCGTISPAPAEFRRLLKMMIVAA